MLALGSRFLIMYSSIISFKYSMQQYSEPATNTYEWSVAFVRYLMLTFAGVFITIIPIQLLDICRLIADVFAATVDIFCYTAFKYSSNLLTATNHFFEDAIQYLTGLNIYQIKSLKYTSDITRLTYEDLIWIALQISLVIPGGLEVPELRDGGTISYGIWLTLVLTTFNVLAKLTQILLVSDGLQEIMLVHVMHTMCANSDWVPYQRFVVLHELNKCIDFSNVKVPLPFGFTKITDLYQKLEL